MKNSKSKNEQLALEARKLFIDANAYDEYEVVGYYRLIRALCKKFNKKTNRQIRIENIQEILKTFDMRKYAILRWRFWEGYTRANIGTLFGVSHERIRQIENVSLERLMPLISEHEWTENSIPIEALGLNTRGYLALKREGINTIEQLIQKEFLSIKGVGPGVAKIVNQKLKDLNRQLSKSKKCMLEKLPIDALEFSTRVNNALKRKGVFSVGQLLEISMDEVFKIKGIGNKGYSEVFAKKQSIEYIKN